MAILDSVNSPEDLKKLDPGQLDLLCGEIRSLILDTVFKNGGHLSSNLGAVEAVVALHYVFNAPKDKIIFDVGHQCYAHKILTGRKDEFFTLRTENGIAGFPKTQESVYDVANTGHASTSISLACGLSRALDGGEQIISFIGDGAMTGGLAFEALNDLACMGKKQIIVLNDNEMSISKNVGLISNYLNRLRRERVTRPFALFGLKYIGIVDGHDIKALIKAFNKAKKYSDPVIVHILTKKGKGYKEAEGNPEKFHGYSTSSQSGRSFSQICGETLCELAEKDKDVIAVTAAMASGTGLDVFEKKFPDRFVDVGIAEAHAACMSAGLALGGKKPYFAVYSTFLQRAYDQLLHDVCLNSLPVTICVDRCGIVAGDGETHQGIFDVPFLTSVPGIKVYSPCCYKELEYCIKKAAERDEICAVRYPRGCEKECLDADFSAEYSVFGSGSKAIITYGRLFSDACEALKVCENLCVIKLNRVFPLSDSLIAGLFKYSEIHFFEEGIKSGGIGEHCAARLLEKGFQGKYVIHAIEKFVPQSAVSSGIKNCGLDSESMIKAVGGECDE